MMSDPTPTAHVESPCIKVCVLDADQMCVGCGRILREIADWSRMTREEQRLACVHAAQRLQAQLGRGTEKR
jgi:predicted Fe-S protein YdhL (DUF1289 family)